MDHDKLLEKIREASDLADQKLRDLRAAEKDMKAVLRECKEERERIENAAIQLVGEQIQAAVKFEMVSLSEQVSLVANAAYEKIRDEARAERNLVLTGNEQGRGPTIFDKVDELHKRVQAALDRHAKGEDVEIDLPNNPRLTDLRVLNRKMRRKLAQRAARDMANDPDFIKALEADGEIPPQGI